jgi:hypothetical protein
MPSPKRVAFRYNMRLALFPVEVRDDNENLSPAAEIGADVHSKLPPWTSDPESDLEGESQEFGEEWDE